MRRRVAFKGATRRAIADVQASTLSQTGSETFAEATCAGHLRRDEHLVAHGRDGLVVRELVAAIRWLRRSRSRPLDEVLTPLADVERIADSLGMELSDYTVSRGPEGELTLARTRPPFDWNVVPRVFGVASIVLPFALTFVGEDGAVMAAFFGAMFTPFAFLLVAYAYAESPTLIDVQRRLEIGDLRPTTSEPQLDGRHIVRVDDRIWPASEDVTVVVGERHHSPKNGPSFKSYSVLLALPDAIVELHCGREMAGRAQTLAAMFRDALRQPKQERVKVQWRKAPDGDAEFAFLSIAAVLVAIGAPIGASSLGLSQRLVASLTGFWVWSVSWASARALRAELKGAGPELLSAVRER